MMGSGYWLLMLFLMIFGGLIVLTIIFSLLPKFNKAIYYIFLSGMLLGSPFLYPLTLDPVPVNQKELFFAFLIAAPIGAIYGWIYYRKMNKKKSKS